MGFVGEMSGDRKQTDNRHASESEVGEGLGPPVYRGFMTNYRSYTGGASPSPTGMVKTSDHSYPISNRSTTPNLKNHLFDRLLTFSLDFTQNKPSIKNPSDKLTSNKKFPQYHLCPQTNLVGARNNTIFQNIRP